MIYINRIRNDENGVPIRPPDKWFELAEAETAKAIREKKNHNANKNIYAHDLVRAALAKLFYDKCAYCYSEITATDDWDVEHFRPKGRVAERSAHPGYYWLTYNWKNLYTSCTHCNQRRKDKPRWGDLRYARAGGKMDQFPLEDETTRAMSHEENINQERICLIDPCSDDPEQFLSYDITGQIFSIQKNIRGTTTIEVCHLNRRTLRDNRQKKVKTTIQILRFICKYESLDNNVKDAVEDMKKILHDNLLDDKCEYAGVARAANNDPDAFGV